MKSPNRHKLKLEKLINKVAPSADRYTIRDSLGYFVYNQPLVFCKSRGKRFYILTPGITPRERRKRMRPYMTLIGNIRIRPDQEFPDKEIEDVLRQRLSVIEQNPKKRSIYTLAQDPKSFKETQLQRQEKAAKRIAALENRFPTLKKITNHPKLKPWVNTATATIEVVGGLFFVIVIVPWILSLLPDINVPLPQLNIPFPTIDIRLPKLNLPEWLSEALYWLFKTLPIWIALALALKFQANNRKR